MSHRIIPTAASSSTAYDVQFMVDPFPNASYLRVETKADRLRRASNEIAKVVAALMSFGHEERHWIDLAEAADFLAQLADLYDPQPYSVEVSVSDA